MTNECVVQDMDLGCQLRQLGRLLTAMEAREVTFSVTTTCGRFEGTLR